MEDERSYGEDERSDQSLSGLGSPHGFPHQNGERIERYSRKVFVGGLPPDIDEGTKGKEGLLSLGFLKCATTNTSCVLCIQFQTRSPPVSDALDICLWTGLTKQKANLIFHRKVSSFARTLTFMKK